MKSFNNSNNNIGNSKGFVKFLSRIGDFCYKRLVS